MAAARPPLWLVACGLSATGCIADMWPNDTDPRPALGACVSTRRAPTLDKGGLASERIAIDGTDREELLIDLELNGFGKEFAGNVQLKHGVGTVELGCQTLPVAVYGSSANSEVIYYYALAARDDRLYNLAFACASSNLLYFWYESTDGTRFTTDALKGTCIETSAPTPSRVSFPAVDMPLPRTVTGWSIEGSEITLGRDGKGSLLLDGVSREIFTLDAVQCTQDCEADDWSQLRTLLWDRAGRRLSYSVISLRGTNSVSVLPQITLPGFQPDDTWRRLTATFSRP